MTQMTQNMTQAVANVTKTIANCKNILYDRVSLAGRANRKQTGANEMNKANTRELNKALAWLATGDAGAIDVACRTLATLQRAGSTSDTKTVLAIIKDHGLSHKFYTDNHCLMAID